MLAHAGGVPETVATLFAALGFITAWMGWSRVRGRGFPRLPKPAAFGLLGVGAVALVAAVVVPPMFGPQIASGPRPRSTATIAFSSPTAGQVVTGDTLPVDVLVTGGRIVQQTTTNITPDTGHVHLYLDGTLISMTFGKTTQVPVGDLDPGVHRLVAEFVAADHAPFNPEVTATVSFVKEAST
jgi:multisubunit Na+/H+ antiporter MnhB subunit